MNQATTQPSSTPSTPEAPTDGTAAPATPPQPSGPPERYAFTAPEGQPLDDTYVAEATPVFRELGLDQASGQKLVDVFNKLSAKTADATIKAVNDMRAGWRQEIMQDPNLGGKLEQVQTTIGRMKDAVVGPLNSPERKAFDDAMNLTGAGDHPAIVRAWFKAAEAYAEGQHVTGNSPSRHGQAAPGEANSPTAAQAMYPNLPSVATRH